MPFAARLPVGIAPRRPRAKAPPPLWLVKLWGLPVGAAVAAVCVALVTQPWPPLMTVRHVLAAPNCASARAVGLAPARRGQPGYWPQHDRDRDGIAGEPWRSRGY